MKISEAIKKLTQIKEHHGDLEILGGYLSDDRPPRDIYVINMNGEVWLTNKGDIAGVFIE